MDLLSDIGIDNKNFLPLTWALCARHIICIYFFRYSVTVKTAEVFRLNNDYCFH